MKPSVLNSLHIQHATSHIMQSACVLQMQLHMKYNFTWNAILYRDGKFLTYMSIGEFTILQAPVSTEWTFN